VVVAHVCYFADVLLHRQFIVQQHTQVAHNRNWLDDVISDMQVEVRVFHLFQVGFGAEPDDLSF
jgi:hypothetical protein